MDKQSPATEAFRLLGVRLRHMQHRRTLKRLLITSTVPKEGKSTVAANLACALAGSTEQKILLLEGDLRRPSLMLMFGLGALPGLCECLQDNHALATSIYCLESMGLWLLPAGSAPGNALDILQSERLSELMGQLSDWFDWIIIDSPPVLPLADASVWARLADGVVLVTRKGVTEKQQLQRGLSALDSQKLVGVLLNCSTTASHSDYYYRPPAKHHAGSQL
jgi:capsular exopolysaccharide synthesis family protein